MPLASTCTHATMEAALDAAFAKHLPTPPGNAKPVREKPPLGHRLRTYARAYFQEGLPVKEICYLYGVSNTTVRVAINKFKEE